MGNDPIRRRLSRQEADLNAANAAAPQGEAQERRVQRRMRGNLPGPEGLARHFARAQPLYLAVRADLCAGASAALHGLSIVSTMDRAARLASAPVHRSNGAGQAQLHRTDIRPCQRGSRRILRQAPGYRRPRAPPAPPPPMGPKTNGIPNEAVAGQLAAALAASLPICANCSEASRAYKGLCCRSSACVPTAILCP